MIVNTGTSGCSWIKCAVILVIERTYIGIFPIDEA